MIKGIGTDIVNIERIESTYAKEPEKFVARLLSAGEQERFYQLPPKSKMGYLAKRFAAKEAVAKALGTGIGEEISFNEIEILNDSSGRPFVTLLNAAGADTDASKIMISLTDDKPFAVAFVVISE